MLLLIVFVSCKKDEDPAPAPEPVKEDTLTTGWTKQVVSTKGDILDVVFYNNSTGYAVSSDNSVYKSANGGTTWERAYTASGNFMNIAVSSPLHAIFVGNNGRVLFTKNGGNTFDSLSLADSELFDVFCLNSNTAFAIGNSNWKTTDGGSSWTKLSFNSSAGKGIWFTDNMNGWAAGQFGLKKTTDGGITWQSINILPDIGPAVYSLQCLDNNNILITGTFSCLKTVDGGNTWSLMHRFAEYSFHDIQSLNNNVLYATDNRYLLKTVDGGSTWQPVVRLGDDSFIELHFTDVNHGWAGTGNGKIIRYLQ